MEFGSDLVFSVKLFQQKLRHRKDLTQPFAKGRNADGDEIQPEKKIPPEDLPFDSLGKRDAGEGDDPGIQCNRLRAPEAVVFFCLDDVEQLGLDWKIDAGDFVEHRGPTLRQIQFAEFRRNGASERAALEPKQFRFDKFLGQ